MDNSYRVLCDNIFPEQETDEPWMRPCSSLTFLATKPAFMLSTSAKVASTTLLNWIMEHKVYAAGPIVVHDRRNVSLMLDGRDKVARLVAPIPFVWRFLVVRNPLARLYSCYVNKIGYGDEIPNEAINYAFVQIQSCLPETLRMEHTGRKPTFDEFVLAITADPTKCINEHWRPQSDMVVAPPSQYDAVLHVETLSQDLAFLCSLLGCVADDVKSANVSEETLKEKEQKLVAAYAKEDTLRAVLDFYRGDFLMFGYARGVRLAYTPQHPPLSAVQPRTCMSRPG